MEVPLGRSYGAEGALTEKIGTLSKSRHRVVKRALGHAFEWDELLGL